MGAIKPTPTKRAVVDVGRKCNINCKFCYYKHLGDLRNQQFAKLQKLKRDVDAARNRGNTSIDITGGEPTIYHEIFELVKYIKETGMKCSIITNGLAGENTTDKLIDCGVDEFLVSVHGLKETHEFLTEKNNCEKQERFLNQIKDKVLLRTNTVINIFNQTELSRLSEYLSIYNPKIVNFINFNPHYDWAKDQKGVQNIVADLYVVEEQLNSSIKLLESKNIGVNVRYYPMCRISEEYRRCVCNDMHVVFDPYEWDYDIMPKCHDSFVDWAIKTSRENELKDTPCNACELFGICGGINKYYHYASLRLMLTPQLNTGKNYFDFYCYRKENTLTLGAN